MSFALLLALLLAVVGFSAQDDAKLQECLRFEARRFMRPKEVQLRGSMVPPVLYTFPGSGNTWTRQLIEYSTGIYTGSVYNDGSLKKDLPGEMTCDKTVSVIKAHPTTHPFKKMIKGTIHSDGKKCMKKNIRAWTHAIFVVRNPWRAIWSEYQRMWSDSHIGHVRKSEFDVASWRRAAAHLAHFYKAMLTDDYPTAESFLGKGNVTWVKYEDLLSNETRIATLRLILGLTNLEIPVLGGGKPVIPAGTRLSVGTKGNMALHIEPNAAEFAAIASANSERAEKRIKLETQRLECAFMLSSKGRVHRAEVQGVNRVTPEYAYEKVKDIICPMWAVFGEAAEQQFGYTLWNTAAPGYAPTTCPKDVKPIADEPRGFKVKQKPRRKFPATGTKEAAAKPGGISPVTGIEEAGVKPKPKLKPKPRPKPKPPPLIPASQGG